jgi:predicted phage terminase large subunit-like protein
MLKQQSDARKEFAIEHKDACHRLTNATNEEQRAAIQAEIKCLEEEIQDIDDWELINYPAIATNDEVLTHDKKIIQLDEGEVQPPNSHLLRKKGDALHPARFPIPRLRNMRKTMQPRHWSALYQQNPVPDEGSYFTKDMFRYRPSVPQYMGTLNYMAVDVAIGERQVNDRTVIAIGSHHWDNTLTIPEMIGGRWDTYTICDNICKKIVQYDIQICGIENGALKMAIWPVLQNMMRERTITCVFDETLTPITDKAVRARPLQGMMQGGMIYFVNDQDWVDTAKHELLRFPGGAHDDYVDALAWLIRVVLKQSAPVKPNPQPTIKSWKDNLEQHIAGAGDAYDHMGA